MPTDLVPFRRFRFRLEAGGRRVRKGDVAPVRWLRGGEQAKDEENPRYHLADSPGSGRMHHRHRHAIFCQPFRRDPGSFIVFGGTQFIAFSDS